MLEGTNLIKDPGIKDTSLPEELSTVRWTKGGACVHRSPTVKEDDVIGVYIYEMICMYTKWNTYINIYDISIDITPRYIHYTYIYIYMCGCIYIYMYVSGCQRLLPLNNPVVLVDSIGLFVSAPHFGSGNACHPVVKQLPMWITAPNSKLISSSPKKEIVPKQPSLLKIQEIQQNKHYWVPFPPPKKKKNITRCIKNYIYIYICILNYLNNVYIYNIYKKNIIYNYIHVMDIKTSRSSNMT